MSSTVAFSLADLAFLPETIFCALISSLVLNLPFCDLWLDKPLALVRLQLSLGSGVSRGGAQGARAPP